MIEPPSTETRSSGSHSLKILSELAAYRKAGFSAARASRSVSDLAWQRAQSYSIQRDDFRTVWHAGHVTAILSNGTDAIVATQTGGVWLVHSIIQPSPLAGYTATSISQTWDTPDISCLAWAPDPSQVFVGTRGSAIVLLAFDTSLGAHLDLKQSTVLPLPFDRVTGIVTLPDPHRIVVATERDVWWSPIPTPATDVSGYDWQMGGGLPNANFAGLAAGPAASVAVAKHGGAKIGLGVPAPGGIYRGTFEGNDLVFAESTISGLDRSLMRRTSLASCSDHPERMYGLCAANDRSLLALVASTDGGATWTVRNTPDKAIAGSQGEYNNCIAVSPRRPDVLAVGWQRAGPFISEDGATTWRNPPQPEPHLHADLHALTFVRNPDGVEPLFVGGDGGVVVTRDMGVTYDSQFNRPLLNLQFYGSGHSTKVGSLGGTLTASSRYPGLLAGGLQDNGNLYRCPDTHNDGRSPRQADTPWLKHTGGDGDLNRFVDPLGVLLNFNNGTVNLGMSLWDETTRRFPPVTVIPADDHPDGVPPTAVELIPRPAFRKGSQLMYAAVGSTEEGVVHGLFADAPATDRPEASNVRLFRLGSVGGLVSAIGSIDGSTLMVGTDLGEIFSFDSASGASTAYALPDVASGAVTRIEVFPSPSPLGLLPDNAFASVDGRILHFNGLFWATTTGDDWKTFAYDGPSQRLFGATDSDVFVSTDFGHTWIDASGGLPARPHCTDLRIAADGREGRDIYLATYGHSVWRATIAKREEEILELPPEMVEILVGVIGDGGGIVRLGKRFVKVPPRPLVRDLLAALVIEDVAHSMSPESEESAKAIQRTALQQIAQIARRELGRLG